jgi:hypothetical protein
MRAGLHRLGLLALFALAMVQVMRGRAAAQAWLADRSRAEGRGILLGDFELHPGVGSEVGYDSNVFLSDDAEESSAILRVAPHLYLSTLSGERAAVGGGPPPTLRFRTGVTGAFKHYFATQQPTDLALGQDLQLVLFPERRFSLEFSEKFSRTIDPFVDPVDPATTGPADYDRDRFEAGAKGVLQSDGGLLRGALGYAFGLDHFEGNEFASNRSHRHTLSTETVYEFLPKTGVFWNGSFALHNYVNPPGPGLNRNDSRLVSTKAGINGGLTERVGFTLAAGYGAGFFDADGNYESVIGQAEARYRPIETVMWSLGYDREYYTAFQGNFARTDRPKTALQWMFAGVFVLGARVELSFVDYGVEASGERDDIHLLTNVNGEYRFTDWLAMTAELGYLRNFTDFTFTAITDAGPDMMVGTADDVTTQDGAEYQRWEAWLGLRAFL